MAETIFASSTMRYHAERWLARLPEAAVRAAPKLCLMHAWLLLNQGQPADAQRRVEDAERALVNRPVAGSESQAQNTLGEVAATRAIIVTSTQAYDPAQIMAWAQAALTHLHADNLTFRSAALGGLGVAAVCLGDLPRAEVSLAEAAEMAQAGGIVLMAVAAASNLAHVQRARGALQAVRATCQQSLDWLTARGVPNWPNAAGVHANLAAVFREGNDLARAGWHAGRAVELSSHGASPPSTLASLLELARVKEAQGDWPGLAGLIEHIEQLPRQIPWLTAHLPAIRAHFHLAQGEVAEAAVLVGAQVIGRGFARPLELLWACEFDWIAPARLRIAQGRAAGDSASLAQALTYLEQPGDQAAALGLTWLAVKVNVLRALAYLGLDDAAQADQALQKALVLAEPEGYVRTFVDEGKPMRTLLSRVQGVPHAYAERLRAALGQEKPRAQPPDLETAMGMGAEALSDRELQVLRLIAAGASNQEIARALNLTLNTVKKHSSNLFAKLGVTSRTQAVARARERRLI
jgi:LuxR family maltose regulon positive regulatory protein